VSAPAYGFGAILARSIAVTGKGLALRPGVVVGVFLDGSRAANHFRCFRCDTSGLDVDGVSELLGMHNGYVYLLADEDGEFVVRESDAKPVKQQGPLVPPTAAPADEDEAKDSTPTTTQERYLRALVELEMRGGADGTNLTELRAALGVRSLYAVQDQIRRLEAKGLIRRRVEGENGRRREIISLTEASQRWLTKK
jgi:hypothetical protein